MSLRAVLYVCVRMRPWTASSTELAPSPPTTHLTASGSLTMNQAGAGVSVAGGGVGIWWQGQLPREL